MEATLARPALDRAALRRAVVTGHGLWTGLDVVVRTGSTNADLIAAARAGAPEGRVLVAEQQTAGLGRAGRRWTSPPRAGLAVSVLLRPGAAGDATGPVPVVRWGWLPMLAGVALAGAVGRVTGLVTTLKWPNDLLVAGGKCAGILAEAAGEAVVVGIGLNVTLRAGELPEAPPGAPPATSLALAGAPGTDRGLLLRHLLDGLASWYAAWRAAGGDAGRCGLRAAYLAASDTVGRPVRVVLPGGQERVGTAVTVDGDGRLVLRDAFGAEHPVAAGDIRHLRAA